jgi:hypothetical protein
METTVLNFSPIKKDKNIFFEIKETPVIYEYEKNYKKYPNKKIIINENLKKPISIVDTSFLPVKHEQAFNLGVEIFRLMFNETPQIHKEFINSSTTDYSVELISEKCKIIFKREGDRYMYSTEHDFFKNFISEYNIFNHPDQDLNHIAKNYYDEYYPFIRVSNYLREGTLFYIELGYYRYRCSNGLIIGLKTNTTFRHSYRVYSFEQIEQAAIAHFDKCKMIYIDLAEKLWILLSIHINKDQIRLIPFDIFKKEIIKKSISERKKLQRHLNNLVDKYIGEIGENLNAALNVATEFSKLLEGNRFSRRKIQSLATIWINKVTKKGFDINKYLDKINNIEDEVLNAKEEEIEY